MFLPGTARKFYFGVYLYYWVQPGDVTTGYSRVMFLPGCLYYRLVMLLQGMFTQPGKVTTGYVCTTGYIWAMLPGMLAQPDNVTTGYVCTTMYSWVMLLPGNLDTAGYIRHYRV